MREKQINIDKYMDNVFVAHGEMIEDNGEDWFIYSLSNNFCLLCVFDGCGGIGARRYLEYDNKSGAYIASHIASDAVYDWFDEFCKKNSGLSQDTIEYMTDDLKNRITNELQKYESSVPQSGIKGALVRNFPTTISLILFTVFGDYIRSVFLWAGDSRGYILCDRGLKQITVDDIEMQGDAFENLSADSKLTNFITSSGDYALNKKAVNIPLPAVLITATDGCFGYFSTPMEFEFLLVDSLQSSKDTEDWKNILSERIKSITGDDYTIGVAAVGYKSFKHLKDTLANRKSELYTKYISDINDMTTEEKTGLWNEYKKFYCEGV